MGWYSGYLLTIPRKGLFTGDKSALKKGSSSCFKKYLYHHHRVSYVLWKRSLSEIRTTSTVEEKGFAEKVHRLLFPWLFVPSYRREEPPSSSFNHLLSSSLGSACLLLHWQLWKVSNFNSFHENNEGWWGEWEDCSACTDSFQDVRVSFVKGLFCDTCDRFPYGPSNKLN